MFDISPLTAPACGALSLVPVVLVGDVVPTVAGGSDTCGCGAGPADGGDGALPPPTRPPTPAPPTCGGGEA